MVERRRRDDRVSHLRGRRGRVRLQIARSNAGDVRRRHRRTAQRRRRGVAGVVRREMLDPGARMSTTLPKFENDDRASVIVVAPTVIASATRAGDEFEALVFELPSVSIMRPRRDTAIVPIVRLIAPPREPSFAQQSGHATPFVRSELRRQKKYVKTRSTAERARVRW